MRWQQCSNDLIIHELCRHDVPVLLTTTKAKAITSISGVQEYIIFHPWACNCFLKSEQRRTYGKCLALILMIHKACPAPMVYRLIGRLAFIVVQVARILRDQMQFITPFRSWLSVRPLDYRRGHNVLFPLFRFARARYTCIFRFCIIQIMHLVTGSCAEARLCIYKGIYN